MNRPASLAAGPLTLAALIFVAALTRIIPHPPNFSPIEAIALFGGAYFANRRMAIAVPLLAMLVSDIALAATKGSTYLEYVTSLAYLPSLVAIYACVLLSTLLGFGLRGMVTGGRVLGYSLAGSLLFFVVTNFMVWVSALVIPGYPACNAGLLACYVAGIPFFQWTVLGTLFYAALLFGGFELLRRYNPALHAQTV
ncbi:MAG: hypothetical protein QM612_08580 [Thermomonas sp.]|uniref:DUF6580 family putative transport protein n=1 Tax=Thermomonas sp. TaxID=1971895 RepID=UPI0039E313FD